MTTTLEAPGATAREVAHRGAGRIGALLRCRYRTAAARAALIATLLLEGARAGHSCLELAHYRKRTARRTWHLPVAVRRWLPGLRPGVPPARPSGFRWQCGSSSSSSRHTPVNTPVWIQCTHRCIHIELLRRSPLVCAQQLTQRSPPTWLATPRPRSRRWCVWPGPLSTLIEPASPLAVRAHGARTEEHAPEVSLLLYAEGARRKHGSDGGECRRDHTHARVNGVPEHASAL